MDEITALKKELSENEFEIRNLENSLKENINTIKSEVDSWVTMGIIDENQKDMLSNLSIENIKDQDLEGFKSLFNQLKDISSKFEDNIADFSKQLKEIENM